MIATILLCCSMLQCFNAPITNALQCSNAPKVQRTQWDKYEHNSMQLFSHNRAYTRPSLVFDHHPYKKLKMFKKKCLVSSDRIITNCRPECIMGIVFFGSVFIDHCVQRHAILKANSMHGPSALLAKEEHVYLVVQNHKAGSSKRETII